MTSTVELRAEVEKTRVELKAELAKTRVEMQRLYVRTVKLLGGFMVVGLGGFTVVYKYLG